MIGVLTGMASTPTSLMLLQAAQTTPGRMTPDQEYQIAMEALKSGSAIQGTIALLVPFGILAMIVAIVWLKYRNKQAQIRVQAEFQKQLLEKFSSGREFAEFLESKGSQRFLDALSSPRPGRHDHVLKTMRIGVVATALGLGMVAFNEEREIAVVVVALGVGFPDLGGGLLSPLQSLGTGTEA